MNVGRLIDTYQPKFALIARSIDRCKECGIEELDRASMSRVEGRGAPIHPSLLFVVVLVVRKHLSLIE
mgnify:CR=1 FL=1